MEALYFAEGVPAALRHMPPAPSRVLVTICFAVRSAGRREMLHSFAVSVVCQVPGVRHFIFRAAGNTPPQASSAPSSEKHYQFSKAPIR